MNEEIKKLTEIIDARSAEEKIEYFANVLEVQSDNSNAKVQLAGTDIIVTLLNKTGEILSVGDAVIVKAVNGDMSNALISYRFGIPKPISPTGGVKVISVTYNTETLTNQYQEFNTASELKTFLTDNGETLTGALKVTCDNSITDCTELFGSCSEITALDLTDFDASNVTNMDSMFSWASALTRITFGDFNTSKVTNMHQMFSNCGSLTYLDLRNFDTSNVTDMSYMFYNCHDLLSLNLNNFDTRKVENMQYMLARCSQVTDFDLRYLNVSNVTNMNYMFYNDARLKRIYCGKDWNTYVVTSSDSMFTRCTQLSGAATYSSSKVTVDYANPDTGYFTI